MGVTNYLLDEVGDSVLGDVLFWFGRSHEEPVRRIITSTETANVVLQGPDRTKEKVILVLGDVGQGSNRKSTSNRRSQGLRLSQKLGYIPQGDRTIFISPAYV